MEYDNERGSVMRDDDITLQQQAFNRDSFRRLIKRTFDDFYPMDYNRENFSLDEYMELVSKEQLEVKYGVFLEMNDENIINLRNMPWLDIGDLPESYNATRTEAWQVFLTPHDQYPDNMVVEFSDWDDIYDYRKVQRDFEKTNFLSKGITYQDIEDSLEKASSLVKMYLGRVTMIERRKTYLLAVLFFIFLFLACGLGVTFACEKRSIKVSKKYDTAADTRPLIVKQEGCFQNIWVWSAFIMVFYTIIAVGIYYIIRWRSSQYLRHSQFLLAVFCRAENNRLYLKHGVELRPGYLGKWIEVNCINEQQFPDIVSYFRARFLKPSEDAKAVNFNKNLMENQELILEQK